MEEGAGNTPSLGLGVGGILRPGLAGAPDRTRGPSQQEQDMTGGYYAQTGPGQDQGVLLHPLKRTRTRLGVPTLLQDRTRV